MKGPEFKRLIRLILLCLLLSSVAVAQDLSWLTGHWVNDESEEVWSESLDGNLMGFNRQQKDGKLVFFEHLRIEKKGKQTLYQACPKGASWTTFELVQTAPREAVFSNPEHDFPQRIHYRRRGETLEVTISGEGSKSLSWTFLRKP